MWSLLHFSAQEKQVNSHLGYPPAYAKLCRHSRELNLPFQDGPPRAFLPYALRPDELAKLEEFECLFPTIRGEKRQDLDMKSYASLLWQRLDHLGNAGFDPAKFRVDSYGNVLYWNADPAGPLAWEVCHWFPYSRGGETVFNNLRIVHWQVAVVKMKNLEFLMPWWDLQLGVSVSFFISALVSKNEDFRQRCRSFFFSGDEDACLVNEEHKWPQQFIEKRFCPAAAIVRMQKEDEQALDLNASSHSSSSKFASPGASSAKNWTSNEEKALQKAVEKHGFGSWKEIQESEPLVSSYSLANIRDKYRSMIRVDQKPDKENTTINSALDRQSILSSAIKKELRSRMLREAERKTKNEEMARLHDTLKSLKHANEEEREALAALDNQLKLEKKQVEKQRQWNETQASYRLCLERMIHETMHQSLIYKEEARLNQVAYNSLIAQLEAQYKICGAAKTNVLKQSKEKEALAALINEHIPDDKVAMASPTLSQPGSSASIRHNAESVSQGKSPNSLELNEEEKFSNAGLNKQLKLLLGNTTTMDDKGFHQRCSNGYKKDWDKEESTKTRENQVHKNQQENAPPDADTYDSSKTMKQLVEHGTKKEKGKRPLVGLLQKLNLKHEQQPRLSKSKDLNTNGAKIDTWEKLTGKMTEVKLGASPSETKKVKHVKDLKPLSVSNAGGKNRASENQPLGDTRQAFIKASRQIGRRMSIA